MELRPEDFGREWRADLFDAAAALVGVIEDIRHHEIGDAWDVGTDPPFEIARIRRRCDELEAAVREARAGLARVERRARLAAIRRQTRRPGDQTSSGEVGL
jgi:hypothetical protein